MPISSRDSDGISTLRKLAKVASIGDDVSRGLVYRFLSTLVKGVHRAQFLIIFLNVWVLVLSFIWFSYINQKKLDSETLFWPRWSPFDLAAIFVV